MQAYAPKHAGRKARRGFEVHRQRRAPQLGICLLGLGDCDHSHQAPTSGVAASASDLPASSISATPSAASASVSPAASASSTAQGPKGLLDLNIDLGLPLGLDLDLPLVGNIHLGKAEPSTTAAATSATSTPAVKVGLDLGGFDVLGVKLGGGNAQPQGADGSAPPPAPITTALASGWRTSTTVRPRPTPQSPAPAPAPPPSAPAPPPSAPAPPPSAPAPPPSAPAPPPSAPAPPPSAPAPPPSSGGDGNYNPSPAPPPPSTGGDGDGNSSPAPPPSSPAPSPPSTGGDGGSNGSDGSASPPPASGGSGAIDNGNSNGGSDSNDGGHVGGSGGSGSGANGGGSGGQGSGGSAGNGVRPNGDIDNAPRSFTRAYAQPVASATIVTSVTTTNAQGQTVVAPTTLATLVPATVENGVTVALSGSALSSALASNEGLTIINGTPVLTGVAAPTDTSTSGSSGNGLNVQALAGGIIGGILALCALIFLYYTVRRRRNQRPVASLPPMSQIRVASGVGNTSQVGGGYSAPAPATWATFNTKDVPKAATASNENVNALARKNTAIGRLLPGMRRKRGSAISEANSFHCRDVDRDSWGTIAASPAVLDAPLPGLAPTIANDLSAIPEITTTAPSTMSHGSFGLNDETPRASLNLLDFSSGATTPVSESSPAVSEASSFGSPYIVEEIGTADGGSDYAPNPFNSPEDALASAATAGLGLQHDIETLRVAEQTEDRPESYSNFVMMTSPFDDPPSQRSSIASFATGLEEIQSEDSHGTTHTRSSMSSGLSDSTIRASKEVSNQFPIPGPRK